jgi:hypothetical protein
VSRYIPVTRAAETLGITSEKLWELRRYGWISIMEKNGMPYVAEHDVYRAKFILHLRHILRLNPIQISRVLLAEKTTVPPQPL